MSRRELVARLCDGMHLGALVLRARRKGRARTLPILAYHRVRDDATEHPFDEGVIDVTTARFDAQMAFISEHFTPLDAAGLVAWIQGGELPPNPICITFDDGYRDNLEAAAPILRRHGVPALFFIATSFIETGRLFWWDRVAFLIKQTAVEVLDLRLPQPARVPVGADRGAALQHCLDLIKRTPGLDLAAFLDDLTAATEVSWSAQRERELAEQQIMTWDELRKLRDLGFDIQSHTCNHRVLSTLKAEQVEAELADSKRVLEAQLDRPVNIVAYPVGLQPSAHPKIVSVLERSGYALGLTSGTGVNALGSPALDRWAVRRLATNREQSLALFKTGLAIPSLAY